MSEINEFQKPPANRKAWDEYWDRVEQKKKEKEDDQRGISDSVTNKNN